MYFSDTDSKMPSDARRTLISEILKCGNMRKYGIHAEMEGQCAVCT
jgi:hypothetical protein